MRLIILNAFFVAYDLIQNQTHNEGVCGKSAVDLTYFELIFAACAVLSQNKVGTIKLRVKRFPLVELNKYIADPFRPPKSLSDMQSHVAILSEYFCNSPEEVVETGLEVVDC